MNKVGLALCAFLTCVPAMLFGQDIPVVVNKIANAKVMLLLDDSNSMMCEIEHSEFSATDPAVLDATKTIPDIIFRLNSGASAPATTQTLVPILTSVNWYMFSVSGASAHIFSGKQFSQASTIPAVVGSSCMNSAGSTVNCPGGSSTPRTGINSLKLYGNGSVIGSNVFTVANLAKTGATYITDSSGNEFLYADYRQNDFAETRVNWASYWPKIDSAGDIIPYSTTLYSTSGGTVVFNNRSIFLSAGLYRLEYLRWLFYIATPAQLASLPGTTRMDAVKDAAEALILANPTVAFGLASLNGSNYTVGAWASDSLGNQLFDTQGVSTVGGKPRIRAAVGTSSATLISEINKLTGAGSTPLTTTYIETLRYFNGEKDNDPYCTNCQYTSPITSICDGSFVVALTDGIPTAETDNSVKGAWISDYDGDNQESAANNKNCTDPVCAEFLDDAAYFAYHNDFSSTLTGTQVIRTYAVGLGLNYDLLSHFAANGGSGQSVQVNSSTDISDTLQEIVSNLITTAVGAAGVATAEVFGESGQVFRPRFEALNWTGTIDKFISINDTLYKLFDVGEILEDRNLVTSARNIIAGLDTDGDGRTTTTVAFTTANASTLRPELFKQYISGGQSTSLLATPLQTVSSNTAASSLISYIHGTDATGMRSRDSNGNGKVDRLGDIVYSRPVYVSERMSNYRSLSGYNSYVQSKSSQPKLLLVGANDGMLHAFDADTGQEVWAYIPSSLLKYLEMLARPTYATQYHKYFVNGQIGVEDVYVNGAWRTYAMFGLGGGGSTWTVLDISNRSSPTLVWEVSDKTSAGESWSEPVVAPIKTGSGTAPSDFSWYMLVGTGEGKSTAGANVLAYSLSSTTPPTPTTIAISASAAAGTRTTGVSVSQNDTDLSVDRGYVGTEEGDLYRIVMNGAPSAWSVAKVYDGGTSQPIVAKPTLVLAANPQYTGSGSGITAEPYAVGVFFGTGRYDQTSDVSSIGGVAQRILGIFDPSSITNDTYSALLPTLTTTNLLNQSVSSFNVTRNSAGIYQLGSVKPGFYMDLDTSIQLTSGNLIRPVGMVTYPALNIRGTVVFSTFLPLQQQCAVGGYGFIQAVNYVTGGGSVIDLVKDPQDPFYNGGIPDTNGNNIYNQSDLDTAYNRGTIQPVFDAHVESVTLTDERPYKHDNKLLLNDIWLHTSNGGVMPAVASLGERGLPGPPAILYQNGQIVVQSAYTDSGDTGLNEDNDDDGSDDKVTICVTTDNSDPENPVRDTRTVSESQLNDYLSNGATVGVCPEDVDDKKVMICHIPPGNPANRHTITISQNAWSAHQAHGDYQGPCAEDPDDDDTDDDDGAGDLENPDSIPINLYTQPVEVLSFREVTTD